MNGPSSMYKLKPVFQLPAKIELPTCMYPMKNPVAEAGRSTSGGDNEVLNNITDKKPLPEVSDLEARWDRVLEQLTDLKNQMAEIKLTMNTAVNDVKHKSLSQEKNSNLETLQNAVINANPLNPPYSLLIVRQLLKKSTQLVFSCHIHSSVNKFPEISKVFSQEEAAAHNNTLKLALIWKEDIPDTELVIHPVKQLPIKGEVNILRYLGRLGVKQLSYPSDDNLSTIQTDSILDTCHRLLHVRTVKEKTSLIRNLNGKLGRTSYFGGENINISDIAAWSSLKQINVNVGQDLTQNMAKWYQRMKDVLDN